MNNVEKAMNSQVAAVPPSRSPLCTAAATPPHTVREVLAAIIHHKHIKQLRKATYYICECLKVPGDELTIDALEGLAPRFTSYLRKCRCAPESICNYCHLTTVLLRAAKQLGWISRHSEITKLWEPIIAAVAKTDGALGIVKYAISIGRTPSTLTDDDLSAWMQMRASQGRSYLNTRRVLGTFRNTLSNVKLAGHLPGVFRTWKSKSSYGVHLHNLPVALRQEVDAILRWTQADYAKARRAKHGLRSNSAKNLLAAITRLYGFAVNVLPTLTPSTAAIDPTSIQTLTELVTPELVSAFIDWSINVRKSTGPSVASLLGYLSSALKKHPNYTDKDYIWFFRVVREIPLEPGSERRERKLRQYLPYDTVADIPHKIHETRLKAALAGRTAVAWAVHHELLMTWLVLEPWWQRNIRECKLGLREEGANLFKATILSLDKIKLSKWAEDRLRVNPREELWQYYFREHETNNHREVHAVLPHRLVPLLEEYLAHHRPCLVGGDDPSTLFLNGHGRRIALDQLTVLVSKLTLRYAGKRITPHMFRDIWAYWWLGMHPEDYLTVSKKLWHRDIEITIAAYGSQFNESHADSRVENYLDSRGWLSMTTRGATEGAIPVSPQNEPKSNQGGRKWRWGYPVDSGNPNI